MDMLKKLYGAMFLSAMAGAIDENGPREATWEASTAIFGAVVFTTVYSRDPSRSNNGGEYFQYIRFANVPGGGVREEKRSSYEDADWVEENFYPVALTNLGRLAKLVCLAVNLSLAPKAIDTTKVRRRVEDALRKTASADDLLAVAGLLGVKTSD